MKIWDKQSLVVSNVLLGSHFIDVEAVWINVGVEVLIVNIYVPCDSKEKKFMEGNGGFIIR